MKQKYMIAICDVLGFSNLVLTEPLDNIIERSFAFLRKSLYHSVHKSDFPEDLPAPNELKNQNKIGLTLFSDTVLLYTLKDNDEDCKNLITTVYFLIFENMFMKETRIRAGIDYGEAYMDSLDDIYIGKPIINAYNLEKSQNWSGAALSKAASDRIEKSIYSNTLYNTCLTKWNVPIKSGSSQEYTVINWTTGTHQILSMPWNTLQPEPSSEDQLSKPDVIEKWKNTKAFHEGKCKQCFPENRKNSIGL